MSAPDLAPQGMTEAELTAQRGALQRSLERLAAITVCCGSCQHFAMGTCAKHGDVPLAFQKSQGQCEDWRYDGVPF